MRALAQARAWHRGRLRHKAAAALAQHAERLFVRQLSFCGAAQRGAAAASALAAGAAGLSATQPRGARASRKVDGPDVFQISAGAEARSLELLRAHERERQTEATHQHLVRCSQGDTRGAPSARSAPLAAS